MILACAGVFSGLSCILFNFRQFNVLNSFNPIQNTTSRICISTSLDTTLSLISFDILSLSTFMLCLERLLKFYSYPLHSMVFKEHRPILIVLIILVITIAKMSMYWLDAWNQNAQDVPSFCLYQDIFSRCYYEWLLKINLIFSASTFLPYSFIYVGLVFQKRSGGTDLSAIKFNRERSITKSIVAILSMTLICQIIPWALRSELDIAADCLCWYSPSVEIRSTNPAAQVLQKITNC
ncbi:Inositol-pentakisphosphate 2-kinase [Trichinella spiralis]|uniref:Inositol-pentakisphosphate 2-kinase n=1 Tax=Trichinella spiralis TaxID=6334 RepID=A0ABR3KX70_TRISP